MAIRWKDVEIKDKNDNVLRGAKAQQFVENNCPSAIENITKTKSLADVVRVKMPGGKTSVAVNDIRSVLSTALAGIAKSLVINEGKVAHRINFPVARAVPNVVNVAPALLQMYLDVDRDGNVDIAPANHNDWTWDVGGHGAVVTVKTREYAPNAVVSERQPIEFRWGAGVRPVNWQATLTANHPNRIRVYRQQAEGATLIPLPWDFTNVGAEDAAGLYRIWIEAVDYPSTLPEADWLVQLDFSLRFNGAERNRQTAVLRIAPWIMVSDLDKTRKLYIVDFGASNNIKNGIIKINNTTVRNEVSHNCGGTTFVPVTNGLQGLGRYLRDAMRFGTHVAPGHIQPVITPVVMRSNNQGTQHNVPLNGIDRVNDGIGYITKGNFVESDLQTGGNMMVSPPVAGYPWGRIICGSGAAKGGLGTWENFLKAQRVQRPILIDTDWLSVGHSDEIVAFVPKVTGSGAGGRNFRMLVTSPRLGYRLLEQAGVDWNAVELAHTNHEVLYAQYQQTFYGHNFPPIVDMRDYITNNLDYAGDNGEGRMGFRRFGNDKRPLHFWLDEFLANDELITRIQGGDAALRAEHLAELQIWFNSLPVPVAANFAYGQLRDTVIAYQPPGGFAALSPGQKNVLKNRLRTEITRLQQLPVQTPADTRRIGLLMLCDHPDIRDLREAKRLLASIADPVALLFPTPADYLTACTQIWNLAQPAIDQLVLNAPINTNLPSIDTISAAIQAQFIPHGIDAGVWLALRSTLRDNLILQAKLSVTVKTISTELNLNPADIVAVPILYSSVLGAKTHVADMVNFVMLNTPGATVDAEAASCTCIVPKPFGPIVNGVDIYEHYFRQQLQTLGITVSFLDEWYEYHLNDGEIHCGTNQLPDTTVAAAQKKWWTKPAPP
jgi:hypothetical protein